MIKALRKRQARKELKRDMDEFVQRCRDEDYTDTGEAWELLDRAYDLI